MDNRLIDSRPPRRDESTTSASSHPELLTGDLAMRPHDPLYWTDRTIVCSGLALVVYILAGVAVTASPKVLLGRDMAASLDKEEQLVAPMCDQWHEAASAHLVRLVQSKQDADLRQVNDAIFLMRRARRNCDEGWIRLACQDYRAIAMHAPVELAAYDPSLFSCRPTTEMSANRGAQSAPPPQ